MSAKDTYHDAVRNALIQDGWTITHDPYTLDYGRRNVFVDPGQERTLGAEKQGEKIAVEIKSFLGASDLRDFENALGQYLFYRSLLVRTEPDRKLFLAVAEEVYDSTISEPIVRPAIEDFGVFVVVFDPNEERIVRWMN